MRNIGLGRVLFIVLGMIAMNVQALSQPHALKSNEADYATILTLARGAIERQLGKPVTLDVRQLQALDDWVFLRVYMAGAHGESISYEGTAYADSAAAGGVSQTYVALLRRERGAWKVIADRVGPTDVVWETWSHDYGAPAALFESP